MAKDATGKAELLVKMDELLGPALTFGALRQANVKRCESVSGFDHPLGAWSPLEWAGAMTGEVGEAADVMMLLIMARLTEAGGQAANTAKKLKRILGKTKGNVKGEQIESLKHKLGCELADVVCYADLLAASQGIALGASVRHVFNEKSREIKSEVRL